MCPVRALPREKYLLSAGGFRTYNTNYVRLCSRHRILQLRVTNLRNYPLSRRDIAALGESFLTLFHSCRTGLKEFPVIRHRGFEWLDVRRTSSLFENPLQGQMENIQLPPDQVAPPGLMPPNIMFTGRQLISPHHPEEAHPRVLMADSNNHVRFMDFGGDPFYRVYSSVHCSERGELKNKWKVSDYSTDGTMMMSVYCEFTFTSGGWKHHAPSCHLHESTASFAQKQMRL